MKHLPNVLSGLRMTLAILLLLLPLTSGIFIGIYIACGLTDIFDGWLARRLNACSAFGAQLDSMADLFFISILLLRFLPIIRPGRLLLVWTAAIALMRFSAALISRLRLGTFGFVHTWANKATGLWLYFCPLVMIVRQTDTVLYSACMIAAISATEELLIALTANCWNPDRKSIFVK